MGKPKALVSGVLQFGPIEAECYVLDNGMRVLSQRGIIGVLTGVKDGTLERRLSKLPEKYSALGSVPSIEFELSNGVVAIGRDAMFLVDLCSAYAEMRDNGTLHPKQAHLATTANAILRAVAKVGIYALVDEVTGHQANRPKDFLARMVERTLRVEMGEWEMRFPPSLVRAMAPLWGIPYAGGRYPKGLHRAFGQLYDLILGRELAGELRKKNPTPHHKSNHHQWLKDGAQGVLVDDIGIATLIASQSGGKDEFWRRMRHHYRKEPLQLAFSP